MLTLQPPPARVLACISSSPATGSTQPSTLCRPRTMNITQSPTTPQPHRRHRTYIPLSLRSIAMKAVSPSPANRRPIPTSSQPLCHAVPASSSTRMPAADFAAEGPRPCRHRGAQLCDGSREHEQGQSPAAGRECWLGTRTPSRGHGSGVANPGPDHRDATIALPWRTYRQVGIRPEKPLGEGVRELAGRVVLDHQALKCLEILSMEFL